MKSEFIETKEVKEIVFPRLMICDTNSGKFIVLFNNKKCGTVVYAEGNSGRKLGDYCTSWFINNFTPINGEVILKN